MDIEAFYKLSYGLYIVTSRDNERESGCVINTMTQVTNEPIQVSIALNKENMTTELIQSSGFFNVSVLLERTSMDIIRCFGFQTGRKVDKFAGLDYAEDHHQIKYLSKDSAAMFACSVKEAIDVGTHILFVGVVEDAKILSQDNVLTYTAYREKKDGLTPKSAPSYQKAKGVQGWRCDVCGFIYTEDSLPDDYVCPVCDAGAEFFSKIKE